MQVNNSDVMNPEDLTPTDRDILDVLKQGQNESEPWGRATKGYLVDETGRSRNSIYNRLEILSAHGHLRELHKGTRLFEFVSDPRENQEGHEEI